MAMTLEGQIDMLTQFFKGAAYTPAWYFGLGQDGTGVDNYNDTAARMTTGAVNWPTTDDFTDSGGRFLVDFSLPATIGGGDTADKLAPSTSYYPVTLAATTPNQAYLISVPGTGPASPPAVLAEVFGIYRPPGPPPLDPSFNTPAQPGDVVQLTILLRLAPG